MKYKNYDINDTAIDLVVRKVYIAWEDNRLSYVKHFEGADGLKNITTLIVNQEKLSPETIEIIYEKVMNILDEIAINKDSATSEFYKKLYLDDLQFRLLDRGFYPV